MVVGGGGRRGGSWRSGARSGDDRSGGSLWGNQQVPAKSDSLSWRKEGGSSGHAMEKGEDDEVISPPKKFVPPHRRDLQKPSVSQNLQIALNDVLVSGDGRVAEPAGGEMVPKEAMLVDGMEGGGAQGHVVGKDKKPKGTYKKQPREEGRKNKSGVEEKKQLLGKKRRTVSEEDKQQLEEKMRKGEVGVVAGNQPSMKRDWRTNLATTNEDCSLELLGVGQPTGSSGASGPPEVGEGGYSVFV